jgi:hypothetical protein
MRKPYTAVPPEALGGGYVRAGGHIFYLKQGYFAGLSGDSPEVMRLQDADASSFEVLWGDVARDRRGIYCRERLPHADRASFRPVPNEHEPWFSDRNGLWLGCVRQVKLLPGGSGFRSFDRSSFEVLSCGHVKDRDGTFKQSSRMESDPSASGVHFDPSMRIWLRVDDPRWREEPQTSPCQSSPLPPLFRRGATPTPARGSNPRGQKK